MTKTVITPMLTADAIVKKPNRFRKQIISLIALAAALFAAMVLACSVGAVNIPFFDTMAIIISKVLPFINFENPSWEVWQADIIFNVRMPRVVMAAVVGAALSIAGATYQGLFRNPLADPYLIGVSQGASFGAVLAMILVPAGFLMAFGNWATAAFAFLGALLVVFLVYNISKVGRTLPTTTLILAGVAIGAFFSAFVSYMITAADPDQVKSIMFWLMGSFNGTIWPYVYVALPILVLGAAILIFFGRSLNLMQLGDDQAQQLGVNVERDKKVLLLISTVVTAAGVAFVGIIGFVGIIIPHATRLIWGPDYRFLLPLSIFMGSIFIILCDLICRTVFSPAEIPIGVITALLGAPFFLFLLRSKMRSIF